MPKQPRRRSLIARNLRTDSTDAERILWRALRDRLPDYKFRRRHPIGNRIADFASPEKKLVIELDGSQHADEIAADEKRTAELAAHGYRVIRFWNNDVTQNLASVLETIYRELEAPHLTLPSLPPRGGEGIEPPKESVDESRRLQIRQ
jgi:very-short-patch-repair endonuclease